METTSSFLCTIKTKPCHYAIGILNHKTVREWNLQHCHILEIMLKNIYFSIRVKKRPTQHKHENDSTLFQRYIYHKACG